MDRIAPSVRLEAEIAELLGDELAANAEKLAELGRLRARLVLQRAVEDEVTAFLGRARYQRTGEASGSRTEANTNRQSWSDSAVLPIPGSPTSRTSRPSPLAAASKAPCSWRSSFSRPTKG
jgi:hypothetical protein